VTIGVFLVLLATSWKSLIGDLLGAFATNSFLLGIEISQWGDKTEIAMQKAVKERDDTNKYIKNGLPHWLSISKGSAQPEGGRPSRTSAIIATMSFP
jgi:hypothetical protein